METIQQPAITGYRELTEQEVELMNECNAIAQQCALFIDKLRGHPASLLVEGPVTFKDKEGNSVPSLDHRWINIAATDLQKGFMCLTRAIAQPTTF